MAKSPLPVDVHRSKTSLLKLPIIIVAMARRRRPSSLFFRGEVGEAVHNSFSEISHYHQYACSKCHVTLLTLTLSMQLSLHVRESKTVLDSGFHTVDSGFQVLDSSLCQWNLESGLQLFVGFGFIELYSGFQSPGLRILKHNFGGFRNPNSLTLGGNSLIDNNRAKKH